MVFYMSMTSIPRIPVDEIAPGNLQAKISNVPGYHFQESSQVPAVGHLATVLAPQAQEFEAAKSAN